MFENSKWIWLNKANNKDEYVEFFVELIKEDNISLINLSCDGDYTLYVNGQFVDSNQYGDYEHYKVYDSIDITSYLITGSNTIKILVWHFGEQSQRYMPAAAGLIFEIWQGGKCVATSDTNVKCRHSPAYRSGYKKKITPQLGYSFLYDAGNENADIGFSFAVEIEKKCDFYLRPISKLKHKDKAEIDILKNEGTRFLIDLRQETVGLPVLEFYSDTRQKLIVCFGENLQDGHVRRFIGERDFSFEYIAKQGNNSFVNYMLRLGCRFLEVYSENNIIVKYIGLIPQYYPVKENGIVLKDELNRRIYDLCVASLKLCMLEHYVDCPWREQNLYVFDSRNQILCGYYAFKDGNREYVRANLKLMSQDKRSDGMLSICFPCGEDLTIPSFSLYYLLTVKEYLEFTGDTSLIEEIYEKLHLILQSFINNIKNGLVCKFEEKKHWNFYDWTEHMIGGFGSESNTTDLMINVLFILALESLKKIDELTNRKFAYENLLQESKRITRETFYNKEKGMFSLSKGGNIFTVLGNSLAILTGVATKKDAENICKEIVAGNLIECSLSMRIFKYDALLCIDEKKWLSYILGEIRKDYKMMLDNGATSTWETIDGAKAFDNAGSLCHGWTAIPIIYYHKYKDIINNEYKHDIK